MAGRPDDARDGAPGADDPGEVAAPDGEDPRIEGLAAEPLDDLDADLLAAVARAASASDPMPAGLVDRARFAVALEELEVEVATIQRQWSQSARDLAGVRGSREHALTMTFTATSLSLTIAVVETGRERYRVDGWVTADDDVSVTLRLDGEARREVRVRDGRFVFDDVPGGMVQVVVRGSDAADTVVTPVFEL